MQAQHLGNGVFVFTHDQSTLTNSTLQGEAAGLIPGLHLSYRRELRSDDSFLLVILLELRLHRINIDSSSEFNGKYYQTKDYFQLKDPNAYT